MSDDIHNATENRWIDLENRLAPAFADPVVGETGEMFSCQIPAAPEWQRVGC